MSTTSSYHALLAAARSCVAEAARADRLGRRRYAELIQLPRAAHWLSLDAIRPRAPVDPGMAAREGRGLTPRS